MTAVYQEAKSLLIQTKKLKRVSGEGGREWKEGEGRRGCRRENGKERERKREKK